MSNSLSPNEANSTELNNQNLENQVCNELSKNIINNNQENETNGTSNNILENKDIEDNKANYNEEEIKNTKDTDLTVNDEHSNIMMNTSHEEDFQNTDKTNFVEEEESIELVNLNINEEEDNALTVEQLNEEENQNEISVEEEEEYLIENDNPVVVIDSDIDYSYDSEDELIDEIFDENRPTITVRRNYQDEFDKRSVRSLRSIRSSRSTRSIKKRHISKIQKYNVTRPFTKTAHFDTKPNPPEDEFKEEHDPIRYAGSRGFLNRQTKSNKHRVELRSQEPTDRGFDPPLYKKKEKIKDPHPPYNWWKPKSEAEGYVSNTPANSYLEDLFRQSVKKQPVIIEEPLPEMYKVNQKSNEIAKQKNQELIEVITGKEKTISEIKFVSIMRRFNISNTSESEESFAPRPLICKIRDIVKLNDDLYDNVKLKELLINAMTGENMDEISTELRPPVLAAFSNIRPSYIIPRKTSKEQMSKSQKTDAANNVNQPAKTQNKNSESQANSNSTTKQQYDTTPANSRRNSIHKNKKIENNDNGDYSTDDESITNNNKKKTKAKTPQKKPNPISTSKKVEDQKANTVKSQKQKTKQSQESEEVNESPKHHHRHKKKKNSETENQSVTSIQTIDMDSNETVEKREQTPKKMVRPKQPTPRGGKYFPGFYDNLDFYCNKSPHRH